MYDYTDKVIRWMKKRFIRLFSQYKSQNSFDELNVLQSSKKLYQQLLEIVKEGLLMIARRAYVDNGGKSPNTINEQWLDEFLEEYDPVTKYVFNHEVERKCARFAESVIASNNPSKEIETALRYWSNMVSQYAITATDKAVEKAYRENDVTQVMWITYEDERRCKECGKRHRKVYDIDKVPPKPHLGCRCFIKTHLG